MSFDQIFLYVSLAGLVAVSPSIPLIFISIRGSIRRAVFRLSLPRREIGPVKAAPFTQALVDASNSSAAIETEDVAALTRCIDYYASHKSSIERYLIEELSALGDGDRRRIIEKIEKIRDTLEQTIVLAMESRLMLSKSRKEHPWLEVSVVQHMAIRGSAYYVRDFIEELKYAISKIENVRR